mmetsp:Transcript_67780/g.157348  ORF Transcript_67780/g.157348 Transcript_67780/m.157348 type:complete len:266 (-) Transcript_67780:54-851(-)
MESALPLLLLQEPRLHLRDLLPPPLLPAVQVLNTSFQRGSARCDLRVESHACSSVRFRVRCNSMERSYSGCVRILSAIFLDRTLSRGGLKVASSSCRAISRFLCRLSSLCSAPRCRRSNRPALATRRGVSVFGAALCNNAFLLSRESCLAEEARGMPRGVGLVFKRGVRVDARPPLCGVVFGSPTACGAAKRLHGTSGGGGGEGGDAAPSLCCCAIEIPMVARASALMTSGVRLGASVADMSTLHRPFLAYRDAKGLQLPDCWCC